MDNQESITPPQTPENDRHNLVADLFPETGEPLSGDGIIQETLANVENSLQEMNNPPKQLEGESNESNESNAPNDESNALIAPEEQLISDSPEKEEVTAELDDQSRENEEKTDETAELDEPPKTINLEVNGETVAIPEDARIPVTIDGQQELISINEFRNSVSGQKVISRRFSALDAQQKSFENRLTMWTEGEKTFNELVHKGKTKDALEFIISKTSVSPDAFFKSLTVEIAPTIEGYLKLSPEERKNWEAQRNEEMYRKQLEMTQRNLTHLQAHQEQVDKIRQVQQKHGLNDASFVEAYDSLVAEVTSGTINFPGEITPETVGEYVEYTSYEKGVVKALKQLAPKNADNSRIIKEFILEGKKLATQGYQMNDDAFLKLVGYVYGKGAEAPPPEQSLEKNKQLRQQAQQPPVENRHWMDRFVDDVESATSLSDRQKVFDKWQKRKPTK